MSALPTRTDISGTPSKSTLQAALVAVYDFVAQRLAAGTSGAGAASAAELTLARSTLGVSDIQPITSSVAVNALTCTLNPTTLDFRSATLGSGTVNTRSVAAAISVVVPSGATLGTVSATAARLVLIALDNAGTVELAITNIAGGVDLSETGLISTTAISAGATAANVVYSTTARTNVAYRVVGYVDITEATAGTWATAASTVQGYGGQALAAMSSLGYGQTWQSVTRTSGTTYYNTTGKPFILCIQWVQGATGGSVNRVSVIQGGTTNFDFTSNYNTQTLPLYYLIPPGASYVVTDGTSCTHTASELR